MKKAILFSFLAFFTALTYTMAANPIAKVQFYSTYNYLEEVAFIENHGVLDGRIVAFLMNEDVPIDQKAAVINTLTANNQMKNNAMTYQQFMGRKYSEDFNNLNLEKLTGEELFCLGYLTLLDDDGNPENALPVLEMALSKDPTSKTIATIHALAAAQKALNEGNQCAAWRAYENVKNNTALTDDMDAGITASISTQMDTYQSACN